MPRLVLLLFAADVSLGLIFLVDASLGDPTHLFHLEGEANIPTWYSSTQWLLVAVLLGAFAYTRFDPKRLESWLLAVLPLSFLALSLDETAGVHELLGHRSDEFLPDGSRESTVFGRTGIWMFILGPPLLAFLLYTVHRMRRVFPRKVASTYVAGIILFVAGAAGVEVLVNFVEQGSAAHVAQVFAEELLEMAGVTFLLWATLDLLSAYGYRLNFESTQVVPAPVQLRRTVLAMTNQPAPAGRRARAIYDLSLVQPEEKISAGQHPYPRPLHGGKIGELPANPSEPSDEGSGATVTQEARG